MRVAPGTPPPVLAAGALTWREGHDGIEVLLIHRPRYQDWSIPKGKLDKTHWSHACLDVVARVLAAWPFFLVLGADVIGGFSAAWHLLTWRESRSLSVIIVNYISE